MMHNQGSKYLHDAHKKINLDAIEIANEVARKIWIDDSTMFAKVKVLLKAILRKSWSPYQLDSLKLGFGMQLAIQHDPKVREIMMDRDLYEMAVDIAVRALEDSIMLNRKIFVQSMLEDLVLEQDNSYYSQFLTWPGER